MRHLSCLTLVLSVAGFVLPLPAAAQDAGKVITVPGMYRAIQAAIDKAEPGDTVFVREGVYKETITLRDDIALIGASAERTVLRGDARKPVVRGAQGAAISHFTIEGGLTGILCANAFMTIESCIIRGNRQAGVHAVIALPAIKNNIIFRNGSSAIFCETTRSHRGYISNNLLAENTYSGIMLAGQSEVLAENNVIYFNKQYGVFASDGARRSRVIHNLFYGNRHPGNVVAMIDRSNIFDDPGYTVFAAALHSLWNVSPGVLRGSGRDGGNIGPVRRSFFKPAAPVSEKAVADTAGTVNTGSIEHAAAGAVKTAGTGKAVVDTVGAVNEISIENAAVDTVKAAAAPAGSAETADAEKK
ncbi:MAG: right-handed parallel beta-helix repeat-containing protein [Chitinispirillia bacterium]|nr:right-handed parallel beta-helix repeat-containing protein [Chitinispirillia bacterium]MCL2242368.1 right-handed parallel beta-helix repeat-containing protein [Chitinispirillia bacterium]